MATARSSRAAPAKYERTVIAAGPLAVFVREI